MNIPLVDLTAQYRAIEDDITASINEVLRSGQFILGPNVAALEHEVAAYLGVKHAIGVGSGTDALILSLRALGIGPGDEVIVPSYTFFATAEAAMLLGARPLFVDVDPDTYCLNVAQLERQITKRTRAILPVHLYGHPADMQPLLNVAGAHGLHVIEDNAQALGAEYHDRKTGALGDVGCLSFFPSKNLGAYGDGGMIVTDNEQIAEQVRMLRTHGWRDKYSPEFTGYNSRLDELQAAILRVKLPHLDSWNDRRRELARRYSDRLSRLGLQTPVEAPGARHIYHLYILRVQERQRVQAALREAGVASAVYYPVPLHLLEPCRSSDAVTPALPVSEAASNETLAIPLYPELTDEQVEYVLETVENVLSPSSIGA
jgi:dTDP-4-amino-4,6-dideoxygalactose transaminase